MTKGLVFMSRILIALLVINVCGTIYLGYTIMQLRSKVKSVKYVIDTISDTFGLAFGGIVTKTKVVAKHGGNFVDKLKNIKWGGKKEKKEEDL